MYWESHLQDMKVGYSLTGKLTRRWQTILEGFGAARTLHIGPKWGVTWIICLVSKMVHWVAFGYDGSVSGLYDYKLKSFCLSS